MRFLIIILLITIGVNVKAQTYNDLPERDTVVIICDPAIFDCMVTYDQNQKPIKGVKRYNFRLEYIHIGREKSDYYNVVFLPTLKLDDTIKTDTLITSKKFNEYKKVKLEEVLEDKTGKIFDEIAETVVFYIHIGKENVKDDKDILLLECKRWEWICTQ